MAKKLTHFLIELTNDPVKLQKYIVDPEGVLEDEDLSDEHRNLILSGDLTSIQEVVQNETGESVVMIFAIC